MSFIKFDENRDSQLVTLVDSAGNAIQSLNGSLRTYDGDAHNSIIDQFIHQHTVTKTTLTVATVGGGIEYQITVASAVGFAINDFIHIEDGTWETTHPKITNIVGNVLTLDRRIDLAHPVGTTITKSILDMSSQIGTMASPQEYFVGPPPGEVWHLTRVLFSMVHGTAGDLGLFGNITPLTNGVTLRAKVNSVYQTLTNWKTNVDIKLDMYDVDFDSRSSGGGSYGTSGRGTFKNAGSVIRLDGDTSDVLEVYIQDDITALTSFSIKVQGHKESS